MFLEYGIKAVSMDDIAKRVGISKRTLYENFISKEDLFTQCINYLDTLREQNYAELAKGCGDIMEILIAVLLKLTDDMRHINPLFLQDIMKYNNIISYEAFKRSRERNAKHLASLLQRGIDEGYIRDDFDIDFMSRMVVSQFNITREMLASSKERPDKQFISLYLHFFRGLATIKGVQRIDELLDDKLRKQQNGIF